MKKKVMHDIDIQYITEVINHKNNLPMHDLSTNFRKFHELVKSVLKDDLNELRNIIEYRHKPKMTDNRGLRH